MTLWTEDHLRGHASPRHIIYHRYNTPLFTLFEEDEDRCPFLRLPVISKKHFAKRNINDA